MENISWSPWLQPSLTAQRLRQIAERAVGIHPQRAMTLGKLRAVGPVDQRNVRHAGKVPSQRLVDLLLARGVDQVIVAPDHMGDAHVVVVDHHREHIGRIAVAAQQHEIVEVFVLPDDAALDLVLDHGLAGLRRLQTDRGLDAGGRILRIAVAPQAVIEPRAALGAGFLAHRGQFLRGRVAVIGLAAGEQRFRHLAVARDAGELVNDVAVPIEPEPFQPVQDRSNRGLGRALAVGVLDPQQHPAAEFFGVQPVKQRGAGAADMEEAGRRGGKAGDDGIGHSNSISGTIRGCAKRGGV